MCTAAHISGITKYLLESSVLQMIVFDKMECAIYICTKCPFSLNCIVFFFLLTERSKCASIVTVFICLQNCLSMHTHHNMLLYVLCTSTFMHNFAIFVFLNWFNVNWLQPSHLFLIWTSPKICYSLLYVFFWIIPQLLNFMCRHFRTHCLFHIRRRVGTKNEYPNILFPVIFRTSPSMKME